jgi:hypothetical protein
MMNKDNEALDLAMKMARQGPDERSNQLDRMLQRRPWFEVARFAAAHCQCRALNLKPWQLPPVWVGVGEDPQADKLWERMQRAGISRYDPDPIRACEAAEAAMK